MNFIDKVMTPWDFRPERACLLCFALEESEVQEAYEICPELHKQAVVELELEFSSPDSKPSALSPKPQINQNYAFASIPEWKLIFKTKKYITASEKKCK